MSLVRKGPSGWFLNSPGRLQKDRFGMLSATAIYYRTDVTAGSNPSAPLALGASHPLWSMIEVDKFAISWNGTFWECEVSFFGVDSPEPTPLYELDIAVSDEPIETHPDFYSTLAGDYSAPLNGATFDDDGAFTGFVKDGDNDAFVGVRSYLAPGVVWRKIYITKTKPTDISAVGTIDSPEGSPPTVGSGRTWLYVGCSWEQRANTYTVRKEWRLSGPRGWNTAIYG